MPRYLASLKKGVTFANGRKAVRWCGGRNVNSFRGLRILILVIDSRRVRKLKRRQEFLAVDREQHVTLIQTS